MAKGRPTANRPRVIVRPSGKTATVGADWRRHGRAHFVSRAAYEAWQAGRRSAETAESFWTRLRRLLQGR
jgi:hypothetical protein